MAKNRLENYLNEHGQLAQWPAKYSMQKLVLAYLAGKFAFDQVYSEQQVNDILKQWHTFGDWAILRRGLIDENFMRRNSDGSVYRLLPASAEEK